MALLFTHAFLHVLATADDIWGDTVNTASRMESHGEPGKICVSESVYNVLKNKVSEPLCFSQHTGNRSISDLLVVY